MKKRLLGAISAIAAISAPLAVVSCTKLNAKQKEVKSKADELFKKYETKIAAADDVTKPVLENQLKVAKETYSKENISKFSDDQCDAAIVAINLLITGLDA